MSSAMGWWDECLVLWDGGWCLVLWDGGLGV